MKRILAICVIGIVVACAASAAAQEDRGFSAQNFQTAPGYGSFLTVDGSQVPPGLGGGVGALLGYQYKPIVVRGCLEDSGGTCTKWADDGTALVKHYLWLDVYGSLSLFRVFELGVVVPAVLYQVGDDATAAGVEAPANNVGLGDVRLHAKLDLLHTFGYEGDTVGLAVVPVIGFPTANLIDGDSFMGDSFLTVHPKLAFGLNFSKARIGLNAGYLWRKTNEFSTVTEIGPRITYGAALEVLFSERVSGILELFGQNSMSADVTGSPLEGELAVRIKSESGLAFTVGGGAGIIAGVGTPVARAFLGLAWMKPLDNDKDKDGILDKVDQCPEDPEDKDDFEDENGCPDPDNDGDGILDGDDGCPNEAEDKDGFEDENGCPDPDNDGDNIPDVKDNCPNEKENVNGIEDEDGCPDEAKPLVFVKEDQIVILEQIFFETAKAKIKPVSFPICDAVVAVLEKNPTIKIRIEGHTDSRGKAGYNRKLSDKRAKAVLKYLVDKGIDTSRLTSEGFGPDKPIAPNETEDGRAKNRRVEFHITER